MSNHRIPHHLAAALCALALAAGAHAASPEATACATSTAPVLAAYRATPPLLASDPAHTLRVTLHADGCAVTQLPSHYVRPGTYAERLGGAEFATLRQHLASRELLRFDVASTRQKLHNARAAQDGIRTRVYDEDIVELDLHPALAADQLKATRQIRWTSLQQDLLTTPDDRNLVAFAAAQGMLAELAARHLAQEATP